MRYQTAPYPESPMSPARPSPAKRARAKRGAHDTRAGRAWVNSMGQINGSGTTPGGHPARLILRDDPGGSQFIADTVRFREVPGLLGGCPGGDAGIDVGIREAARGGAGAKPLFGRDAQDAEHP